MTHASNERPMTFPDRSAEAALWIYPAPRALSAEEQAQVLADLEAFFAGWQSHARLVLGSAAFHADRFLLVAAELAPPHTGPISGCGMDAGRHAVEATGARLGMTWQSGLNVFFRDADGTVRMARRGAFRKRIASGEVTAETPVFDLTLTSVAALRRTGFEKPLAESWHAEAFGLGAPA
jgi:hypothetical protein